MELKVAKQVNRIINEFRSAGKSPFTQTVFCFNMEEDPLYVRLGWVIHYISTLQHNLGGFRIEGIENLGGRLCISLRKLEVIRNEHQK